MFGWGLSATSVDGKMSLVLQTAKMASFGECVVSGGLVGAARVIPDRQERGPKYASKFFSKFGKFSTAQQKQLEIFLHLGKFDGKEEFFSVPRIF